MALVVMMSMVLEDLSLLELMFKLRKAGFSDLLGQVRIFDTCARLFDSVLE